VARFAITAISLMKSDLEPGGARYTELACRPLGARVCWSPCARLLCSSSES